jgi:UDP-glucose 6-dehydrogenase
VVEESAAIYLCQALRDAGYAVSGHDPLARAEAAKALGSGYDVAENLDACLAGADTVFVATPDPAFASLRPEQFSPAGAKAHVVDFWRCLGREVREAANIAYLPGGRCWDAREAERKLSALWAGEDR